MKKVKGTGNTAALCLLIVFMTLPLCNAGAQSSNTAANDTASEFPQWAKDVRRFEIVAFGSIPFTMLMANTIMDSYRWYNENGMKMTDEGRRYAPWPLKSAGAVAMSNSDQEKTLWMAAGLSLAVAAADMIIVQIKRYKARQRTESLPPGTIIITRTPLQEEAASVPPQMPQEESVASDSSVP